MNTTQSPIFALHEPQHFSDYGFDSQFDYFQVLEEARKHKRETCSSRSNIDNLHFKLQKPVTKDDNSKKIKKSRKRWWKHALHFFKRKRTVSPPSSNAVYGDGGGVRAVSGPVYLAESRSGNSTPTYHRLSTSRPSSGPLAGTITPYHRLSTSRPSSGPLAGTITPVRKGDLDIPYVSLTEVNVDQSYKISASPMPIYLVT